MRASRLASSILKLSTGLAMVMACAPVLAAEQAAQSDASASDDSGIAEIIVTAQRRQENLQKAALAITAVSAETLERAGVTDTSSLSRISPALQIGTLNGPATQYYIRGVGKFTANSLTDSAVSISLDGVPIARDSAVQGMFYDLERVEVLKGPQGTLYGRNATGGAINVITAKPKLGETSGYVNGEYGNYDAMKLNAAINLPMGENTAMRVAGSLSQHDGYYSDGTGDERLRAVRAQVTSKLSDTLKVTIGADYAHSGGVGTGATVGGLDIDKRIGMYDPRASALISTRISNMGFNFFPISGSPYNDNDYWGVYGQADIDTSLGALTLLASHRDAKVRNETASSTFPIIDSLDDDQTSIEARLASDDSNPLSYIVGAFYLHENTLQRPVFSQQFFVAYGDFDTQLDSMAGFARLSYKVTDTFRLTGGARYTIDKKSGVVDAYNLVVVCPAFIQQVGICPGTPQIPLSTTVPAGFFDAEGNGIGFPTPVGPAQVWGTGGAIITPFRTTNPVSKRWKKATYRLGFEFDVGPQSMIYGAFETGFKSGGFFNSIDNPIYNPETINAITLGSKNRFLNNHLQLNIEAFWWDYKNQQVSHFRVNSLGGQEFITENIGKTRIRGFEVEAIARVTDSTTLNATVQYTDAKYRSFVYSNAQPPLTGCPSAPQADHTFLVNCSGLRTNSAPEWSIVAGIEQNFDLSVGGSLTVYLDGRYQSGAYMGFERLPALYQSGYAVLDASVRYQFPGNKISVTGYINNLTDKTAIGFATAHPFATPFTNIFGPAFTSQNLRAPQTYGIRVGVKY